MWSQGESIIFVERWAKKKKKEKTALFYSETSQIKSNLNTDINITFIYKVA